MAGYGQKAIDWTCEAREYFSEAPEGMPTWEFARAHVELAAVALDVSPTSIYAAARKRLRPQGVVRKVPTIQTRTAVVAVPQREAQLLQATEKQKKPTCVVRDPLECPYIPMSERHKTG